MKTTSPFKEKALLEKEIIEFVNKFKATVSNQATRMSDFFEMSCFNHIVQIPVILTTQFQFKVST